MTDVTEDVTLLAHIRAIDDGASQIFGNVKAAAGTLGAALVGAYKASIDSALHYSEAIEKVAFLTGMSTEKSAGLIGAFRAQGFTTDEATMSMQRLTMRLGIYDTQARSAKGISAQSAQALAAMGLSAKQLLASGGDLTKLFPSIIDHLKNMKDPLERDRLAMQLFGRNFGSIAPLIEAGGAAFLRNTQLAAKFGDVLSGPGVAALHQYKSSLEITKMGIEGIGLQLAMQALPLFQKLQDLIQSGILWWDNLGDSVHKTVFKAAGMIAVFGTLFGGAAALQRVLVPLLNTIPGIGNAAGGLVSKFIPFFGIIGPLVGLFIALKEAYDHNAETHKLLTPLVQTLGLIFKDLMAVVQTVIGIFQGFTGTLKGGPIDALNFFLKIIVGPINSALQGLASGIQFVNKFLIDHKKQIVNVVAEVTGWLKSFQNSPLEHALERLAKDLFPQVQGAMSSIGQVWTSTILPFLQNDAWPTFQSIVQAVATGFGQFVDSINEGLELFAKTNDAGAAITKTLTDLGVPMRAINIVVDAAKRIWAALVDGWNQIASTVMPSLQSAFVQLQPVMAQLQQAIQTIGPPLLAILGVIGGAILVLLGGAFGALVQFLKYGLPTAIQFAVDIIKVLVDAFSLMATFIAGVVNIINDLIHGRWGQAWKDAQKLFEDMKNGILKLLGDLVMMFVNLIAGLVVTVVKTIQGFVSGILGMFEWLVDQLVGHSVIPDLINKIVGFFQGLPGQVLGILGGLANSAIGAAKTLGSNIVTGISNGLGGLKWAMLHAMKMAISGLPGGDAMLKVPPFNALAGYATGGVVGPGFGGAHMAVVGEGREAEVIATLSQAVRAGMAAVSGGGGLGGNVTIEFHVDGRLIERRVTKITGQRMRLQGASLGSGA